MDSFEANTQFNQLLRSINPSVQSLKKTAHFAIKNWENEDYLFPSILDILNDIHVELNTKSTIFQLIDVLINESFTISAHKDSAYSYPYINNLKSALPQILLKVLPGHNNYNLYNVFNSLRNISKTLKIDTSEYEQQWNLSSEMLSKEEMENIDLNLPYPEVVLDDASSNDPVVQAWELLIKKRKQSFYDRLRLLKHQPPKTEDLSEDEMFYVNTKERAHNQLTKKQILLRMEDDRETHKRSKESLWVVERPKNSVGVTEEEFMGFYWNKFDKLSKEDEKALFETLEGYNEVVAGSYKDVQ
ncbi:hypothetical protein CLIB1444_23S00210 [[Candida] jaroonii]|uniref:Uncharacterized protein n=1 Tax=[Candida] jaroonii TaxID=467808 RepID=A0ACA9YG36_9ASCO|nr:hypothetical protein CLIB1444_23S00210 [[Candida] jaroonii]